MFTRVAVDFLPSNLREQEGPTGGKEVTQDVSVVAFANVDWGQRMFRCSPLVIGYPSRVGLGNRQSLEMAQISLMEGS